VNKAIVEGMMYLLTHEGLNSKRMHDEVYKKMLEDKIKSKSPEKLTNDLVFENLMDKTRKKQLNFKKLADQKPKRKRKKNSSAVKPIQPKLIISEITYEKLTDVEVKQSADQVVVKKKAGRPRKKTKKSTKKTVEANVSGPVQGIQTDQVEG